MIKTWVLMLLCTATLGFAGGSSEVDAQSSMSFAVESYSEYVKLWYGENLDNRNISQETVPWEGYELFTRPAVEDFYWLAVMFMPPNGRFDVQAIGEILTGDKAELFKTKAWENVLQEGYQQTGFHGFSSEDVFRSSMILNVQAVKERYVSQEEKNLEQLRGTRLIMIHPQYPGDDTEGVFRSFAELRDGKSALITTYSQISYWEIDAEGQLVLLQFLAPN
jgi:hypothetical protein